jgi:hypothetical protein
MLLREAWYISTVVLLMGLMYVFGYLYWTMVDMDAVLYVYYN